MYSYDYDVADRLVQRTAPDGSTLHDAESGQHLSPDPIRLLGDKATIICHESFRVL
uniref:hypothetical protein n=1 Tax=Pectobacterium polonicum TaxID=2485124 RepID=UPI0035ABE7AB